MPLMFSLVSDYVMAVRRSFARNNPYRWIQGRI